MSASTLPPLPHLDAVLVDTSAFYAFFDSRAEHHRRIADLLVALVHDKVRLIITNHIRAETHALILNRRGHHFADLFLSHLRAWPQGSLVFATEADEDRALGIIEQYRDKDFSLADAVSFAVMERLGLTQAVTLDRNFQQYGFITL
ncbi:MAG: type II toxin-antitoxin system VapC family toxin [Chloroflexota bacterium]